jgi:phosphoserine aminotransferase
MPPSRYNGGMAQPYNRIFNFSAGPGVLPVEVLEQARDEMMNYGGSGASVAELSHRSKTYEGIIQGAEADIRTLASIPDNYKVLFLQGGASLQFSMLAMNFLGQGQTADYIVTGAWGEKAVEAAQLVGNVNVTWNGKSTNFDRLPDSLGDHSGATYTHFTTNETIQGVEFQSDPDLGNSTICDMSSDIFSRPLDVSKYAMIYAGAQKNMGPAGACLVILRDDMLDRIPNGLGPMLDYRIHAKNGSMYNTPPAYTVYMIGLVVKHLLKNGGLQGAFERNTAKAKLIYDAIDGSGGFYKGHAQRDCRSLMNITFTLPSDELTDTFVKEAKAEGMIELKGHRSVGGCRASTYNSMPHEGCVALSHFMAQFAARNG